MTNLMHQTVSLNYLSFPQLNLDNHQVKEEKNSYIQLIQQKVSTDLSSWPKQLAMLLSLGEIILLDLHNTCMTDIFIQTIKPNGWLVEIQNCSEQIHEVQRAGVGPRNTHLSIHFSSPCSLVLKNLRLCISKGPGTHWQLLGLTMC